MLWSSVRGGSRVVNSTFSFEQAHANALVVGQQARLASAGARRGPAAPRPPPREGAAALKTCPSTTKKTKRPRALGLGPDSSTLPYITRRRPAPAPPPPPSRHRTRGLPWVLGPGGQSSSAAVRALHTLHVPEDHGVVAILAGLRAVPRRRHHLRRSVRPGRHSRPAHAPTGRTLPFVMKSSNEVNLGCHPVRSRVRLQSPGPLPTGAPSSRSPVNVHSQAVPSTPEARVASIMRSRAMGSAPSHPRNTSPRNAAPPCSGGAGARRQRPQGGGGGGRRRLRVGEAPPPAPRPSPPPGWPGTGPRRPRSG